MTLKNIIFITFFSAMLMSCNNNDDNKKINSANTNTNKEINKIEDLDLSKNISVDDISNLNIDLEKNTKIIIDTYVEDTDSYEPNDNISPNIAADSMVSFDIKDSDFNILSIVLDTYFYNDKGESIGYVESYNLSKDKLKYLKFDDIFSAGSTKYFEKEISDSLEKLKANKNINFKDGDENSNDQDQSKFDFKIKDAVLYFEKDNAIFLYTNYKAFNGSELSKSFIPAFRFQKKDIESFINVKNQFN